MKTLINITFLAVFVVASAAIGFAQDDKPTLEKLYTDFRAQIRETCGKRDKGIATGKQFIELYGDNKEQEEVVAYVKKKVPEIIEADRICKRNDLYNTSFTAKNWPVFLSTAKEIMNDPKTDPKLAMDVLLDAVSVGYDRAAVDKTDTYNAETINNAKAALAKLSAPGVASSTTKWGVFVPFNTKEDAVSWINFMLAFYAEKGGAAQMNDKLGYLYKASLAGEKKNDISIYKRIGDFYFDQVTTLFEDYKTKLKALPVGTEEPQELKDLLAKARGYADRGFDAYSRAYKLIPADKTTVKSAFMKDLQVLYRFRNAIKEADKIPDLEPIIATQVAKPFPDPLSTVTPVVIEEPTASTTTPTTPTAPTTTTPATKTPTAPVTKPATTPVTKPVTTPATKPAAKTTGTTSKSTSTVKKKGTR